MTIARIDAAIKSYAKGLISEEACIEQVRDLVDNVTQWNPEIPIIDVFGLGPQLDPEAYGLPARGG